MRFTIKRQGYETVLVYRIWGNETGCKRAQSQVYIGICLSTLLASIIGNSLAISLSRTIEATKSYRMSFSKGRHDLFYQSLLDKASIFDNHLELW